MSENRVSVSVENHVAQVRLTRPDKMNALDPAMFEAIIAAGERLKTEKGVRSVVLSGEGRSFCAGLDMASMAANAAGEVRDLTMRDHGNTNDPQEAAMIWRKLPMPVIGAVHGVCFGGGLQVASGPDIRFVAPDARLAVMEAKWGLVPDMAGYPLWRGNVRDDILRELTYTSREFTGEQAQQYGFMTHVSEDPLADATKLAHEIAVRSPDASRAAKRMMNNWFDRETDELLMAESVEQNGLMKTPNQIESVRAGMTKTEPNFMDS